MKKFENILVAFDLNKTLFFKSQSPLPRMHDKKIKKLFFYLRPYVKELIQFLHSHEINYCFWSNMIAKNCKLYIHELQSFGMNKHCGVFSQNFCDMPYDMPQNINQQNSTFQKVQMIKNLNKLAHFYKIDVDNCILVDDSKQKSVQGCHLIHVNSFLGDQKDDQILQVIQKIKQFRIGRVNEETKSNFKLQYIECHEKIDYVIQKQLKKVLKGKQFGENQQKNINRTPAQIEQEKILEQQLKKFRDQLALEKQTKKATKKQIEAIKESLQIMAEQVKKQSEGKILKKGDQLLVQVLMFAKTKKASEQKLEQLQKKKRQSEGRISTIKKLMRQIMIKLNINDEQTKEEQPKHQNNGQNRQQKQNKKSKKDKKQKRKLQDQKHENKNDKVKQTEQDSNEAIKSQK